MPARWTNTWLEHCHLDAACAGSLFIKDKCIHSEPLRGHTEICIVCYHVACDVFPPHNVLVSKSVCSVSLSYILDKWWRSLIIIYNSLQERDSLKTWCVTRGHVIHLASHKVLCVAHWLASSLRTSNQRFFKSFCNHNNALIMLWADVVL